MKATILFIFHFSFLIHLMMQAQTQQDATTIERFNFEAVGDSRKSIGYLKDNWYIHLSPPTLPGNLGHQFEYAPAKEFYLIYSEYHPNGIIKRKARFIGDVVFGKDEYFNERGKLIKSTDEDAKFGKIKPQDIPGIIEKIGLFNTKTGENIFTKEPLPTNGRFTSNMFGKLDIYFAPAEQVKDGTSSAPLWLVIYRTHNREIYYTIDGETGEYIREEEEMRIYY